jgi:hypothetical protein
MNLSAHHIHDTPHVEIVVAIDRATRVPWDCLLREVRFTLVRSKNQKEVYNAD